MQYETSQQLELKELADQLADEFEGQPTEPVLKALLHEHFPGRIGLVSSFGTEAAILLHLVSKIDPYTPVIFLDTWKHFPETLAYRDELISAFGLCNLQTVTPRPVLLDADDPDGDLYDRDPDRCCHIRKTRPMLQALRSMDCWITGRKRYQAVTRQRLTLFEVQDRWIKVNPLVDWTADDVTDYYEAHALPLHPLKNRGYPSVGCEPCTRAVSANEDSRAGRWAGTDKTECGIHFQNGKIVRA